jgi:tetratricopeptide (TPR) repeat protein
MTTPCPFCARPFEGDLCPRCDEAVDVDKVLGLLGPAAARRSNLPPREIGRFRVVRRLGEGGTGVVYEALDPVLGRPLALKVLKAHGLGPELVERFLREARFLARFRHPNVVQLYELGRHEGRDFLAMELIEGQPFPATSDRREAVARLARVARALGHIHRRSIVHRDLKPSNILVDAAGRPVVMDFGIARSAEAISTLSLAGSLVGTPAYMSPEQFEGETADARTDVYALGVILYEVLAGRRPYEGKTVVALAQQVRDGRVPPLPGVPEALAAACFRALALRPEDRFQTADAFAEALEAHLHGAPRRPAMRRDPRLLGAVGGALAGLLLLAGFAAVRADRAPAAAQVRIDPAPLLEEGRRLAMAGRFEDAHAAYDRALAIDPAHEGALAAKGDLVITQQFALHVDRLHFPETIRAMAARLAATQGPAFDRAGSPLAGVYALAARARWEDAARKAAELPAAAHLKEALDFFREGRPPGAAVRAALQQRKETSQDAVRNDRDVWPFYILFHELRPLLSRSSAPPRPALRTSTHAGLLRVEALVHEARGEKDKALATLERALAAAPDFLPARLARARLLRQAEAVDAAAAELEAARRQAQGWGFTIGELDLLLR